MVFLVLLLLLYLTSCCYGTLVVTVAQKSYQAEENQDITLEWTFTTTTDPSLHHLFIICQLLTDVRAYFLFHLHEGVEVPESQDPQFAGRVQWDKDVLTEGRLTLHVSRLRTNDSGEYKCNVFTDYGQNNGRCWLNVTAADKPSPLSKTVKPRQMIDGMITFYIALVISAVALLALFLERLFHSS